MTDSHPSTWVKARDTVESFISNGLHAIWHGVEPIITDAAPAVGKALLDIAHSTANALLTAKASGASGSVLLSTAKSAAIASAKEQEAPLISAGIVITEQHAIDLANLMTAHVVTQDAPPPPAVDATTAPAV